MDGSASQDGSLRGACDIMFVCICNSVLEYNNFYKVWRFGFGMGEGLEDSLKISRVSDLYEIAVVALFPKGKVFDDSGVFVKFSDGDNCLNVSCGCAKSCSRKDEELYGIFYRYLR